jgi:hypothetical protein
MLAADLVDLAGSLATALIGAAIGAWAAITTTRKALTHATHLFERELAAQTLQFRRDQMAQAYGRFLAALGSFAAQARSIHAGGQSTDPGRHEARSAAIREVLGSAAAAALLAGPQIRAALESLQFSDLQSHLVTAATGTHDDWDGRQNSYENLARRMARDMDAEIKALA